MLVYSYILAIVSVILRRTELGKYCRRLESRSQTVIFHSGIKYLDTFDADGRERWFEQEVRTDIALRTS